MRGLLAVVAKDLRLLVRDRAGLLFLGVAPLLVITVAGLSLANLYGSDPTGQTAYELPVVDEDGSTLAHELLARLEREPAVRVRRVASRDEARRWVRDRKRAGSALVIPTGTEAALRAGRPASLLLYTDAVKYLERLNVRLRLAALVDGVAAEQAAEVEREARAREQALAGELARLEASIEEARAAFAEAYAGAQREHAAALAAARAQAQRGERELRAALVEAQDAAAASLASELEDVRAPLRAWLDALAKSRAASEAWLGELVRRAGRHASEIPPPPAFPEPPPELARLLDGAPPRPPPLRIEELPRSLLRLPELPPLPAPAALAVPALAPSPSVHLPGPLRVEEQDVSGGGGRINTFDQNVPGFSVTFLLLGMLLGISLALLDERDWGTFDRLRSMPVGLGPVLGGKLVARFVVGVAQMLLLFAIGRAAFGISLGPAPWALLLPIAGITFAGVAFGLVVAAVAPSREAVLPVGSAVVVTMAAIGGCWWPIDLEPRWMRTVALAFPTTWAMDAFNDLMIRRRGAERALVPTAVMLGYGTLYLVVGLALFRARLERR